MEGNNSKSLSMVYTAMCAVIIAVCSWITIPFVVPFTLQTFGVFFAVALLGGKRGSLAVGLYMLMGVLGVPVFSGFRGGLGVLLGVTGGYITGFLAAVLFMWCMEILLGKKPWVFTVSMVLGLLICYGLGSLWYIAMYTEQTEELGWMAIVTQCVLPFVVPDGIKMALVLLLRKRFLKMQMIDR